MKIKISPADTHRHESTFMFHIASKLPLADDCDVILVTMPWLEDYHFNDNLYKINKPWILLDYIEYTWDWNAQETHIWTKNTGKFLPRLGRNHDDIMKFDKFVKEHPPILTFKRELLEKDRTNKLLPLEYVCYLPRVPIANKEEFDNRKLEVHYNWGLSNPLRPKLHADIYTKANAYEYVSSYEQIHHCPAKRIWASLHCPWWCRKDYKTEILPIQCQSKLTVSLFGNGIKCFRSSEAPVGGIMALVEDNLAWSFPWIDNYNSIRLRPNYMHEDISSALEKDNLYDTYLKSQDTIDQYRTQRYIDEYLLPKIEEQL
jgi:hypothetical protein